MPAIYCRSFIQHGRRISLPPQKPTVVPLHTVNEELQAFLWRAVEMLARRTITYKNSDCRNRCPDELE